MIMYGLKQELFLDSRYAQIIYISITFIAVMGDKMEKLGESLKEFLEALSGKK